MNGFANRLGYSDVEPFEVVRVVSDKCLEVRRMDAERDKSVELQFDVGGFAAHCVNQRDQKWIISSNPSNPVLRIRLGKQGWKSACGSRFALADKPIKFYDYNF
jgi:hypothetical protein